MHEFEDELVCCYMWDHTRKQLGVKYFVRQNCSEKSVFFSSAPYFLIKKKRKEKKTQSDSNNTSTTFKSWLSGQNGHSKKWGDSRIRMLLMLTQPNHPHNNSFLTTTTSCRHSARVALLHNRLEQGQSSRQKKKKKKVLRTKRSNPHEEQYLHSTYWSQVF